MGLSNKKKEFYSKIIGTKFNSLTIVEITGVVKRVMRAKTQCECGNISIQSLPEIVGGTILSCGCAYLKSHLKHGLHKHPLYRVWADMRSRCLNENATGYHNYGGNGVKICEEWSDFKLFYDWAIKEWAEGLKLDKDIKGNGKLYSPETCCFVTSKTNNRNKRTNVFLTHNGITETLVEWSERLGVSYDSLRYRIRNNWSVEKALTTPFKKYAA